MESPSTHADNLGVTLCERATVQYGFATPFCLDLCDPEDDENFDTMAVAGALDQIVRGYYVRIQNARRGILDMKI